MDFSGGLNKLLQNRLFMQYLSSAGAGLTQDPTMQALDSITQQNLAAQSQSGLNQKYMQMLQGMMSGKIPEGGKVVQTDKGTKIEIPQAVLENVGAGGGGTPSMGRVTDFQPMDVGQVSKFNPFQ